MILAEQNHASLSYGIIFRENCSLRAHCRGYLVDKLKTIENAMGFSFLLFFQPLLLILDLQLFNLRPTNWSRDN